MDLDQQLATLTKQVGNLQAQLSRDEGQLEALQDQRTRIMQACKSLNVEPDQLDTVIAKKEQELTALLKKIDKELTQVEEERGAILENAKPTTEAG